MVQNTYWWGYWQVLGVEKVIQEKNCLHIKSWGPSTDCWHGNNGQCYMTDRPKQKTNLPLFGIWNQVIDGSTDGRTDGPSDGRTDEYTLLRCAMTFRKLAGGESNQSAHPILTKSYCSRKCLVPRQRECGGNAMKLLFRFQSRTKEFLQRNPAIRHSSTGEFRL